MYYYYVYKKNEYLGRHKTIADVAEFLDISKRAVQFICEGYICYDNIYKIIREKR